MDYDEFIAFCAALPATSHVVQWGNADVWKVGGKVFAIGRWSDTDRPAFVFKTSALDYEFLCHKPGYKPAPYFASRGMKWIQQYSSDNDEELRYYLSESHRLASLRLSKTLRKQLGLGFTRSAESTHKR